MTSAESKNIGFDQSPQDNIKKHVRQFNYQGIQELEVDSKKTKEELQRELNRQLAEDRKAEYGMEKGD